MSYQLALLDQSPLIDDELNETTLSHTVALAQKAEQLGYKRFWVSEHHNSDEVAGSSPEVLVSYLLAKTNKIRIGSGGVMLQHYSPYKVAENFHVLASLAGDRVDLGIGKAPGGLPLSTKALQYQKTFIEDDFYERLTLLKHFIQNDVPDHHEYATLKATPIPQHKPELILLGGSSGSALHAAKLGISFSFAQFFNSNEKDLFEAAKVYREHFPSGTFSLAINVIASNDEQKAKELAASQTVYKVHIENGKTFTLLTEEQAEKFGKQSGENYTINKHEVNVLSGTPIQIKQKLDELHEKLGIDEFIYHTPVKNTAARLESFELLSPANFKKLETSINV